MYPHLNQINMTGRLTKDPELKRFSSGSSKVSLSVAINNRRKVGTKWENAPLFLTVEAWNQVADNIAGRASKGMPIFFTGQLIQESYKNSEGETRTVIKASASSIMILPENQEQAAQSRTNSLDWPEPDNTQSNDFDDEEEWNEDIPF